MDVAATRIADAVEAGERIALFGDYDVDGATSAALLARQSPEGVAATCEAIAGSDFYTPTSGLRLACLGLAGIDDNVTMLWSGDTTWDSSGGGHSS